jgi:hypothetical protein
LGGKDKITFQEETTLTPTKDEASVLYKVAKEARKVVRLRRKICVQTTQELSTTGKGSRNGTQDKEVVKVIASNFCLCRLSRTFNEDRCQDFPYFL